MRKHVAAMALVMALGPACGPGDDGDDGAGGAADERETVEEVLARARDDLAREAPGVTDDTIRVGVSYVDTEALRGIIDLDHGDYEATYGALFDRINAGGGIHGRRIEPVYAAVSPVSASSGEVACARLARDRGVFLAMGFFQADALPCYLETYDTAVIGGAMTSDQLERADPPWFTADTSGDLGAEVIRSFAASGALEGRLGVVALQADEDLLRSEVLLLLDELGIEPAASALVNERSDASSEAASTATEASVADIADRFDAAGVDTLLVVGPAGAAWAYGAAPSDYRPRLLFTAVGGINAYVSDESNDVSLLEGSTAGALYDGDDVSTLPAMRACLDILEAAGVTTMEEAPEGTVARPNVAASIACRNVSLFRAIADAAGPGLTYGSFRGAGEGLGEVTIPGYPDPFRYGRPPSADGDPVPYLFRWEAGTRRFVVQGSP